MFNFSNCNTIIWVFFIELFHELVRVLFYCFFFCSLIDNLVNCLFVSFLFMVLGLLDIQICKSIVDTLSIASKLIERLWNGFRVVFLVLFINTINLN